MPIDLAIAWARPERGAEAALMLAQLLDAQTGNNARHCLITKLGEINLAADKVVRERIDVLEQYFQDYQNALKAYNQEIAQAQTDHVEGLESKGGWRGDNPQHANPIKVAAQRIEDGGIQNTVLSYMPMVATTRQPSGDESPLMGASIPPSFLKYLIMASTALPISLAVKSGPDYAYHESPAKPSRRTALVPGFFYLQ